MHKNNGSRLKHSPACRSGELSSMAARAIRTAATSKNEARFAPNIPMKSYEYLWIMFPIWHDITQWQTQMLVADHAEKVDGGLQEVTTKNQPIMEQKMVKPIATERILKESNVKLPNQLVVSSYNTILYDMH